MKGAKKGECKGGVQKVECKRGECRGVSAGRQPETHVNTLGCLRPRADSLNDAQRQSPPALRFLAGLALRGRWFMCGVLYARILFLTISGRSWQTFGIFLADLGRSWQIFGINLIGGWGPGIAIRNNEAEKVQNVYAKRLRNSVLKS